MKSIADIMAIREAMQSQIILRDNVDADKEIHIIVGMGTVGVEKGARAVFNAMVDEIEENKLVGIRVTRTGSLLTAEDAPVVEVRVPGKEAVTYTKVDADAAVEIVKRLAKA